MNFVRVGNASGFSLVELVTVLAIISVLAGIAFVSWKPIVDKYNAESQIRMMQTDILQARVKAMERNKAEFIALNPGSYQIIEDTNENGAIDASPADTWQPLKTIKYVISAGTGTLIVDSRGLFSTPTSTLGSSISIQFNTGQGSPEYDCFQILATRINVGKMNGVNCVPR